MSKLEHTFKSSWDSISLSEQEKVFSFSEGYKEFLGNKTEIACTSAIAAKAKANGFINFIDIIKTNKPLVAGDKIYAINRDKAIILFVIGTEPLEQGMHIVGSHIDAPRLDLKPFPLYEDSELAFLKTHYYGGIKKYQWTAIPLALHGVVYTKNGERVIIEIGEDINDPVFTITDLLPHLAKDQAQKKLGEAISGEGLNVLIGSMPLNSCEKNKIKNNILQLLQDKYAISEIDFTTAELEIVPAGPARDLGLDRSMVLGYGQDDRVCSYAALEAILNLGQPTKTAVTMFMDKEEVGSQGNTGSESAFFEYVLAELLELNSRSSYLNVRRALTNTKVLSADVGAAFDPNYADVYEKQNSAFLGKGILIAKYTGARGKAGCNDANAEFLAMITKIFNEANVDWQIGELGKVDQGGGGTIAYILANAGADVVDCGTPILSMHAPYEVSSKIDIYTSYNAYKAFLEI